MKGNFFRFFLSTERHGGRGVHGFTRIFTEGEGPRITRIITEGEGEKRNYMSAEPEKFESRFFTGNGIKFVVVGSNKCASQLDSVHTNISLLCQGFIEQRFYFICPIFPFEQSNEGASVQNVSQLCSSPGFGKKLPELLFFEFLVLTAHFKEAVYCNGRIFAERLNFFQCGAKVIDSFFLKEPMNFIVSGRSCRHITRHFKRNPAISRNCYRSHKITIT